ncbi:hypothetical protein HK099_001663 [Clydaea vesicula]|uniref:SAM-dependent MTase RsmB/NOP-type domain-containing protein n=1 Tax=Clydaea vesicula TaxID=447962 RepID=A0AAD5XZ03_9FUNG|nr:hypothetical protein HK099_001663 [Clydaea vesicula]
MTEQLHYPDSFLTFLEEESIDIQEFDVLLKLKRYIRIKENSSVSKEDVERDLNTTIDTISYLPNYYSLDSKKNIANSQLYKEGQIFGIDLASGIAVYALDIHRDDHVLDLCCAPGAKLCYIADLQSKHEQDFESTGTVTGVDVCAERMANCKTFIKKYKLDKARLFVADGTKFDVHAPSRTGNSINLNYSEDLNVELIKTNEYLKPFHATKKIRFDKQLKTANLLYDKVLCDVECTHEGSIAHIKKYFDRGWDSFEKKFLDKGRLAGLEDLQRGLINNGFKLLKPGSKNTCSFSKKQNEDIIVWFLKQHKDSAVIEPVPNIDKFPAAPNMFIQEFIAEFPTIKNVVRFTPKYSETSGLFIARIKKTLRSPS